MRTNVFFAIIWLSIAAVFLTLGTYHWKIRGNLLTEVDLHGVGKIEGVSTGLSQTENELNAMIRSYNESTRQQNLIAAVGYWIASLTAIISMIIEIRQARKKRNDELTNRIKRLEAKVEFMRYDVERAKRPNDEP